MEHELAVPLKIVWLIWIRGLRPAAQIYVGIEGKDPQCWALSLELSSFIHMSSNTPKPLPGLNICFSTNGAWSAALVPFIWANQISALIMKHLRKINLPRWIGSLGSWVSEVSIQDHLSMSLWTWSSTVHHDKSMVAEGTTQLGTAGKQRGMEKGPAMSFKSTLFNDILSSH